MGTNDTQELTVRLRCIDLPGREFKGRSNIRLGVQKSKDVIEDVFADAEEVIFTCSLRVERNAATGKPNFLGPYAQGTPAERFLYLCWGERKVGVWDGVGRAKIHLKEIEWSSVENVIATGEPLEAIIKMTDKKGGPLCASVPRDKLTWQFSNYSG